MVYIAIASADELVMFCFRKILYSQLTDRISQSCFSSPPDIPPLQLKVHFF